MKKPSSLLGLGREGHKVEPRDMSIAANRLFKEQNRHKGLVAVRAPRQPSQEERELRGLTRIPALS